MINKLMSLCPGQGGNQAFNKLGLRCMNYNLMLELWKLSFLEREFDFTEPTYTFDAMKWQFKLLEKAFTLKWPTRD